MQPARERRASARPAAVRPPEGEIVLIPKQLRMEWTDVVVCDASLPDFAVRVALVIATHFNKRSGDAYPTKARIADILGGRDPKAVWRAVKMLEERGYLVVSRRECGTRKDGRRVAGGRGVANTYAPACDGQRVVATARGVSLVDRCRALKADAAARAEARKQGVRPSFAEPDRDQERRATEPGKEGVGPSQLCTDPSDQNPARASAEVRRLHRPNHLGDAGARLEARLGMVKFHNWFREVTFERIDQEELTLTAPSRCQRDWIEIHFTEEILHAWRGAGSPVRRLRIVVRP